jgi:hypothetical protein
MNFPEWHNPIVARKNGETRSPKQILASVAEEMNKPRLAASVKRELRRCQAGQRKYVGSA